MVPGFQPHGCKASAREWCQRVIWRDVPNRTPGIAPARISPRAAKTSPLLRVVSGDYSILWQVSQSWLIFRPSFVLWSSS
jgi:hypothetical protein